MKFQFALLSACLAAPLALFAQAPAAPAAPRVADPAKSPPATTAASKPVVVDKTEVDPAVIETMRKAFAAQRAKGSFRARMDAGTLGGGDIPTVEMEFVFPDRMKMKMADVEVVGVGDKTMMKMGEGWLPAPAAMKSPGSNFGDPKRVDEMLTGAVVAKSLGPTKIDGLAVESYQLNTNTKEGLSKSKIYLTPADSLIRRIETEANVMGKDATSTLDYYDYGAPIRIELPN
jgi:hypothetical protein